MPADPLRHWLLTRALPLWLAHGVDHHAGGFHEHLTPGDYGCSADFRRLRVLTRQIFVFARAHRAGMAGADAAVAMGIDLLTSRAALPEGGFARRLDLAHAPLDTTRDLYDHAFALLALANATAVLPAAPLRGQALALLDHIEAAFPHPAGGYLESLPPSAPRRQNPHMHLLEALLAAHEAFPDSPFLDRARALVALFETRLFDPACGALPEFFDDALTPLPDRASYTVEPGHHYEWAWLLHRAALLTGAPPHHATPRLLSFATRHGLHQATGDVIDSVRADGSGAVRAARLWPQTERHKAARLLGGDPGALESWLLADGLWVERRDAAGAPIPGPVPASSLYHLTCAILADPVRG
jgi:mannose-6-phosphate isomerase